ncbi:serine/threonine-protein kinase/endoribonuclease ire-1-like isoform X2 [Daphnia pulex]|nr:serine/threonine-protein kinase/endoribonuclease ire-1-like isoform X2 [Daphnia pulex]XP_046439761.1 serine/threonine-protein kinase/endoribonuclease ire-1-like isoform X2 [Daphnia pulex]
MFTFIYLNLRRLKNQLLNLFCRLIRNISSIAGQQPEATGEQRVSPTLVINRNRILGEGRYGYVFEGTWEETRVAVKRIEIERTNEREETALQQCDHHNVITLLDVQSDQNFKYYVLEFCVASLDHLFLQETDPNKYRGPMPATKKDVCLQLAKGMEHIHEQRLIHRDVKPENVLIWVDSIREKVLMKWADFGLSKPVSERGTHSISSEFKGSEDWYALEICRMQSETTSSQSVEGENVANPIRQRGTVKSDVFSEGLVFAYYLLGGRHPYGKRNEIPKNILNARPVNMNEIEGHPMHDIIMDMWNTDPAERISSSQVVERISNIEGWQEPCIPPSP